MVPRRQSARRAPVLSGTLVSSAKLNVPATAGRPSRSRTGFWSVLMPVSMTVIFTPLPLASGQACGGCSRDTCQAWIGSLGAYAWHSAGSNGSPIPSTAYAEVRPIARGEVSAPESARYQPAGDHSPGGGPGGGPARRHGFLLCQAAAGWQVAVMV